MTKPADQPPHLCADMTHALDEDSLPIVYFARMREYGVSYQDGTSHKQMIYFCPFCGARLPSSLRDEFYARRHALGLDDDDVSPEPMQSDRWWREAGL